MNSASNLSDPGSIFLPSQICCCSFAQSCQTLCNLMDCSTPDFPALHYLLEFAQTHDHWVDDAIQPSHPIFLFSSCPQSFLASGSFPVTADLTYLTKHRPVDLSISKGKCSPGKSPQDSHGWHQPHVSSQSRAHETHKETGHREWEQQQQMTDVGPQGTQLKL